MAGIAIPLVPETLDEWKSWVNTMQTERKAEFDDFNARWGLTEHRVWLNHSPNGPVAIVVHDGPGSDTVMQKIGASDHPFDVWFRDNASKFHGVNIADGIPGPPPETLMNWHAK